MGTYNRNRYSRNGRNGKRTNKNYKVNNGEKSIKKLDMRREEEFNYMLGTILKDLPDSLRGALRGSIYSIASIKGIKDAKDYVIGKKNDGTINDGMEKNLIDLLYNYSKYR